MPRKSETEKKREELELRRTEIELREKALTVQRMEREEEQAKAELSEHLVYQFFEEVSDKTVSAAISELTKWSRRFPKKPIKLVLNSPGGCVISGLALYDCLRSLSHTGNKISVTVLGLAASMGGVLLCAADRRVMGAGSWVLIHEVAAEHYGPIPELEDQLAFSKRLWDRIVKILSTRSKLSEEQIRKSAHRTDWWLSAEECLELGLVDEVIQ